MERRLRGGPTRVGLIRAALGAMVPAALVAAGGCFTSPEVRTTPSDPSQEAGAGAGLDQDRAQGQPVPDASPPAPTPGELALPDKPVVLEPQQAPAEPGQEAAKEAPKEAPKEPAKEPAGGAGVQPSPDAQGAPAEAAQKTDAPAGAAPGEVPAAPPVAPPAPTPEELERQQVLAELQGFYRDLGARNWTALEQHFWPGATLITWERRPPSLAPTVRARRLEEFVKEAQEVPGGSRPVQIVSLSPEVRLAGDVAHVWSPFSMHPVEGNGGSEHKGFDSLTFLRIDGHWKVFALVLRGD